LIRDEPVIRSGREANYEAGKDTGRFWDAGAANVHWVIVKDDQVERGIKEALTRVKSDGVLIEGNSFLEYVTANIAVMCARAEGGKVKPSARHALTKSDLLYLSSLDGDGVGAQTRFEKWRASLPIDLDFDGLPILTLIDLSQILARIRKNQTALSVLSSGHR